MKALTTFRPSRRALSICAMAAGLTFALSSCAGSAGSGGGGGGGGDAGSGFEYGASQEDVNAAIEGLDPITITFQPSAASQNSVMAPAGTVFKELVEERSNGQIEVEIVWGQAIAGYAEVHDALADGRIDVALSLIHI